MSRVVVLRVGAVLLAVASWAATGVVLAATVGVTVGNYYFEDATVGDGVVTARVGDQLRFTVVDTGTDGRAHTADVDELGIHSGGLPPGSTWTSPVITQPGTFLLYCKVHLNSKNHKTTLVVSGTAVAPTATPSRATAGPATLTPTALASVPAAPSGSLR